MKIKVFAGVLVIVLVSIAAYAAGLGIQAHILQRTLTAQRSSTIEAYLGHKLVIKEAHCKASAKAIRKKLDGPAQSLDTTATNAVSSLSGGELTPDSYSVFARSESLKYLQISASDSRESVKAQIDSQGGLKSVVQGVVEEASAPVLNRAIENLNKAKLLPESVDTSNWSAAFAESYSKRCSKIFEAEFGSVKKLIAENVNKLASFAIKVADSDWQGSDFEKISPLVAYAGTDGYCPSYVPCAIFKILTPAICKVQLQVDFFDTSGDLEDSVNKTVKISKAFRSVKVVASERSAYGSNGGTYKIEEAKCL